MVLVLDYEPGRRPHRGIHQKIYSLLSDYLFHSCIHSWGSIVVKNNIIIYSIYIIVALLRQSAHRRATSRQWLRGIGPQETRCLFAYTMANLKHDSVIIVLYILNIFPTSLPSSTSAHS